MNPSSCHYHHTCKVRLGSHQLKTWSLLGTVCIPCALVECPNPHGMVPISAPHIYKVSNNHHMQWMGTWIHHQCHSHHTCDPRFGKSSPENRVADVSCMYPLYAIVKAPNPHRIDYTSAPHIFKQSGNLQMQWMGTWICYHTILTTYVIPDFVVGWYHGSLLTAVCIPCALLLSHQTLMEWLSHPLPTYTRYATTIICNVLGHESIIMPLPPHMWSQIWEVITWKQGCWCELYVSFVRYS